jgi:hypothetical protein
MGRQFSWRVIFAGWEPVGFDGRNWTKACSSNPKARGPVDRLIKLRFAEKFSERPGNGQIVLVLEFTRPHWTSILLGVLASPVGFSSAIVPRLRDDSGNLGEVSFARF